MLGSSCVRNSRNVSELYVKLIEAMETEFAWTLSVLLVIFSSTCKSDPPEIHYVCVTLVFSASMITHKMNDFEIGLANCATQMAISSNEDLWSSRSSLVPTNPVR